MLEATMSNTDPSETDLSPGDAPDPPPLGRIAELALGARPAEVSDSARHKLFQAWERAGVTIQKAEQMRLDAIKDQSECAEAIVRKLGGGVFRYKEKLYVVLVSPKGIVYLREQTPRVKRG